MKRYFIFIAIILGMVAQSVLAQTAKQTIAVYITGDAESGVKKVIGSKLVTGITCSEEYTAVERTADFLAELTKEQDYQMSGAVSDNQIARLGQQFGVRYVLVADISEVFGSMFISARMIDVQTAQITNSTESNAVVDNMESLTKIAENIVLLLFYAKTLEEDVKVLGPFSYSRDLVECNVPENYYIATRDEVVKILKVNKINNKKTKLPIYTDINDVYTSETQAYTVTGRWGRNVAPMQCSRTYYRVKYSYTFIEDVDLISHSVSSYIKDDNYNSCYNGWPSNEFIINGMYDRSSNPYITPGYVYVLKKKK